MKQREWEKLQNGSLVEVRIPGWGWTDAIISDEKEGRGRVVVRFTRGPLGGWRECEIYPPLACLRERPEGKRSSRPGTGFHYKLDDLIERYRAPAFWKRSLESKKQAWARAYSGI